MRINTIKGVFLSILLCLVAPELYYDKYKKDLYNHDKCVVREGFIAKPPKYYDTLYDIDEPEKMQAIKKARKKAISKLPEKDYKRLATLEKSLALKMKTVPRKYEGGE